MARARGIVGGEEAHGGAGAAHINGAIGCLKSSLHSDGVVALGQVEGAKRLGAQCPNEQQTIADALRCRQCDGAVAADGCCESIIHVPPNNVYAKLQ